MARACRTIEEAETPPTLAMLADKAGLSSFHFHRLFRAATGVTPKAYAAAHRAGRLAEGLRARHSVTQALYEAGFGAPSRLYAAAPGRLGMSPSAFRKGGEGALIRFALGSAPWARCWWPPPCGAFAPSCSATTPGPCWPTCNAASPGRS